MAEIKQVVFNFMGTSVMTAALETVTSHCPSRVGSLLQRHYHFAAAGDDSPATNLYIYMTAGEEEKDSLSFAVYEYEDLGAPDYDPTRETPPLSEFSIILPEVLGESDWRVYLEYLADRFRGTPEDYETARQSLHDYLAQKLQEVLREKGIEDRLDITDVVSERELISMFCEYRNFVFNPEALRKLFR